MSDARPAFGLARLAEETRERFLREVLTRVPLERLVELHLFAPIRQGGMESGVAVLAATPAVVEAPGAPAAEPPADVPADPVASAADLAVEPAVDVVEAGVAEGLAPAPTDDVPDADPTEAAAGEAPGASEEGAAPDGGDAVSQTLPQEVHEVSTGREPDSTAPHAPPRRHTVFTARYRLVVKGPDRGRWAVEVREEADAPLITVEAVVRGVQQRSGDASDPERLDAGAVARLLGVPFPGPA